jgi:hypothetical protein
MAYLTATIESLVKKGLKKAAKPDRQKCCTYDLSSRYGACVGGPKYYAVNLILRLFLYRFLLTLSSESIHNNTNTHEHQQHGGGAACPSSGVDLMIPCRPRGGRPCTYIFQGHYRRIEIDSLN